MINESEKRIPPLQELPVKLGNFGSAMTLVVFHKRAHLRNERFGGGDELRPGNFSPFVGMPQPENRADALAHDHGENLIGFERQFIPKGLEIANNMRPTELNQTANPVFVIFDISRKA